MFGTGGLGAASLAVKCAEDAPAATAAFQDWRIGVHMGVSLNGGFPPNSSILIGFSIINHPFWGTTILGNPHIWHLKS